MEEIVDTYFEFPISEEEIENFVPLKDHKYQIVSKVAYLIGVDKGQFGEGKNFEEEIFKTLNIQKNARIIRNLCRVRTSIERGYKKICAARKVGLLRAVILIGEAVPQDSVMELINDGIKLPQNANAKPEECLLEINKLISDRINNCSNIFPTWLNWSYLKDLFVKTEWLTNKGVLAAAKQYYSTFGDCPYHCFINWPYGNNGNILLNDKKFVCLLYATHKDIFTDISKVMDVSEQIKSNIYDYIESSKKLVMIVDCENSDVYNIISMLKSLKWDNALDKVSKIILINDVHTNIGWQELPRLTDIPVEHIMTQRLKEDKSLVDGTVIAKTYDEYYENHVDSFILLSSDSDFWTLIKMLTRARFLVMVEHQKCSNDLKQVLEQNLITYCYLDDFYSGEESEQMKIDLLLKYIANDLKNRDFNIKELFENSLFSMRINMTDAQKKQFFIKHLRNVVLNVDETGSVSIKLKEK